MGIKIINSFELNSPLPLDARAVANNINEMNELITKNFVVAGQMCYNKADNKLYVLKKNSEGALLSWHEIADSVDLDNINKVLPTDIAVKDNKLGLKHDNTWLTNQNAINLGDNMTYDEATKTLNAKGGGESVSPTLSLLDLTQGIEKTTLTEQEKTNLEKGLYNQILWVSSDENLGQFALYLPSKLISVGGTNIFALMDVSGGESPYIKQIEFYYLRLGEKNTSGEYPITITKADDMPNFPFGTGGGSSEIPTLSTIAPSMSDLATTVYSDDDIALIKKQKDNFIKVPFGTAENNTSELCYVFSLNNAYSLIDVAGSILSITNAFSSSPNFLYFNLDETNKKLVGESYSSLSTSETSLYVLSSDNQIYLTDQLKSGAGQVLNKAYYFDKINGKSIIHEENTINNYTIPTITFED